MNGNEIGRNALILVLEQDFFMFWYIETTAHSDRPLFHTKIKKIKAMKNKKMIYGALTGLVLVAGAFTYENSEPKYLPNDGETAVMITSKPILDERYLEVFVVGDNPNGKGYIGATYNTTNFNGPDPKNSAPQKLVDQLNTKEIAKDLNGESAFINGPRVWCLDWAKVESGQVRDFDGLQARWVANLEMKDAHQFDKGKPSYYISKIKRTSVFGINKGTKVFLMDDDQGRTWVMKSYSLVLDSTMTREKVPAMMAHLDLPEGWSYRVVTLDRDLVLKPTSGVAQIVTDNADNVYDLTGPGYSNFQP